MGGVRWSVDEESILGEKYFDTPHEKLAPLLPKRTWLAILQRGRGCGLNRRNGGYFLALREPWNKGKKGLRGTIRNFPDLSPSHELAYIIGVMLGDGHLHYNGSNYEVELGAKDRCFVEEFSRCLTKIMKRDKPYPLWKWKHQEAFTTRATSKFLFHFLKDYRGIKSVIDVFPADFIRGFADSEGHVAHKTRTLVSVGMSNTELWYLSFIQMLLKSRFNIHSNLQLSCRREGRKTCYSLMIHRKHDVELFTQRIGFTIPRKQDRLTDFLTNLNIKCKHEQVEQIRGYFGFRLRCVNCKRYVRGENN